MLLFLQGKLWEWFRVTSPFFFSLQAVSVPNSTNMQTDCGPIHEQLMSVPLCNSPTLLYHDCTVAEMVSEPFL